MGQAETVLQEGLKRQPPGWLTLRKELVHGDEDDGDAYEEVERQLMAEQRGRHDAGEDGGDR